MIYKQPLRTTRLSTFKQPTFNQTMAFENDDFEPTIKGTIKEAVKTKKVPRWRLRQARRLNHTEYVDFCKLTNETPEPAGGQISAAKLKGSPEYIEKVNKMAERRAHVRTHEPAELTTNVRWCGCSTEIGAQYCCWCAEYGAPDMKPIPENKWGSKYVTAWTPVAKKRKIRPYDKPCMASNQYKQVWPRADAKPLTVMLKYGDPYDTYDDYSYTNTIIQTVFYRIY